MKKCYIGLVLVSSAAAFSGSPSFGVNLLKTVSCFGAPRCPLVVVFFGVSIKFDFLLKNGGSKALAFLCPTMLAAADRSFRARL